MGKFDKLRGAVKSVGHATKVSAEKTYRAGQAIDRGMQSASGFVYEGTTKKHRSTRKKSTVNPRVRSGNGRQIVININNGPRRRPKKKKKNKRRSPAYNDYSGWGW